MKKSILFLTSLFLMTLGFSQSNLSINGSFECGTDLRHQHLLQTDSKYAAKVQENERLIKQFSSSLNSNKTSNIITIPVVVHIIHTGQAIGVGDNISMSQVNSAITALNDRYRNTANTGIDTEIEFVLAKRDPNGNATTGVNRIDGSSVTNYSTEGITAGNGKGAVEVDVKNLSRWPNTEYYNVWVVNEIEDNNGLFGIQGYAYFPGASSTIDGTIIMNTCFGTTGTVNSFNNLNRTFVHEVGHGLNLYHTFEGDLDGTTCPTGNGDYVADTDPHIRASSNCPSGTNTCTGNSINEVTSNFMNYSSQTCAIKFTADQKTRMRAAINASRPSLISSQGGIAPVSYANNPTCISTSTNPNNSFGIGIRAFELNNIKVVSGSTNDDGGYVDRSKHYIVDAIPGNSYTLSITTGTSNNEDVKVFIDYNGDGDFADSGEEVFSSDRTSGSPVNNVHSGNIVIPSVGITKNTPLRIRVISDWYNNSITSSCYNPAFGQTEDYAIYITALTPPIVSISSQTNNSCFGSADGSITAVASSGISPYVFTWSNGGNNSTISGLIAGAYTVTVTDANNLTSTTTTTINQPTIITTSLSSADETCSGVNGAINLTVTGGTPTYSYFWSNGSTTQSISNLSAGTYTITIVDANGCTKSNSKVIIDTCSSVLGPISLIPSDCNATNLDIEYGMVQANYRTNATSYRYRLNGSGLINQVLVRSSNRLYISSIPSISFGQTFAVEVAAFINGQWTDYGAVCNISTKPLNNIDLKLYPQFCGATGLDLSSDFIMYYQKNYASSYRVRFNGPGVNNVIKTTTNNRIYLSGVTGMQYGQTYTVDVAAFVSGQWSSYGTACSITTNPLSSISSMLHPAYCGATNMDERYSFVQYYKRNGATNYRVRFNGPGVNNVVKTTTNDRIYLPGVSGIQNGQTYVVDVDLFVGGQWVGYGTPCNISIRPVGSARIANSNNQPQENNAYTLNMGSFSVYPNPATNEIINLRYVAINSELNTKGTIQVIDIKGNLLFSKDVNIVDGNVSTFINDNDKLVAGLYIIRLVSNEETTSKKLIIK